jgi:membrane-bound lytic murein transglycosylase D
MQGRRSAHGLRRTVWVRAVACAAGVVWLGILGTPLTVTSARVAAAETQGDSSPFPVPPGLKTQVKFWKDIFATYSTREVVIHDTEHLNRVYEVIDFRPLADGGLSDAEIAAFAKIKVEREKERVRAILVRLHQLGPDPSELTEEERKIWALFRDVKEPSVFLAAAAEDRIRAQAGLRDRFAAGVEVSRRYLPVMEAIFRREGLPEELTRLPLVESCFNVHAYSKVGAAGIWQFMRGTGRLYMQVDNAVDERRDPITSTEAAAQHLKRNYEVLGTWPLAITAYNHGRAGMARAVSQVGTTDIVEIIRRYNGPSFKFASRNFYAEFLAALEVEHHFSEYFGELSASPALRADTVLVPDYVSFQTLARVTNTDPETLAELNPALSREVVGGKLYVPRGYRARVPEGGAEVFEMRYASLPAHQKFSRQRTVSVTHRVKRGQTLVSIAKQYGVTIAAIQRRNKLRTGHVRVGQSLVIPSG